MGASPDARSTCMLRVGDRVVLRATSPPEAEYALFELGDIELRASEPGRVREHGYQTTVERARERLAALGITAAFARECAVAMHPILSEAYARGPSVRHVARYFGPLELFQSDLFDASYAYHGVFLDLPQLARDLDLRGAAAVLQAFYLAALLEGEDDATTVFLATDAWTKTRKPGERSHKRPALAPARDVANAIAQLARLDPKPDVTDHLPRADVIAFVRSRADAAPDDDGRVLYEQLEKAVTVREMPERGPLADPELWALELRIDAGTLDGVPQAVEELERARGRTPGTTYLRARVSLALKLEPPKLVAERVSALALSMTSFQELSLLAAEAWLDAGETRRAMPYARDLVDAPGIDEGLLLKAQRLLARAVGAAPEKTKTVADSMPAAAQPPSVRPPKPDSMPPVSAPDPNVHKSFSRAPSKVATIRGEANPNRFVSTNPGLGDAAANAAQQPPPPSEPPQSSPKSRPVSAMPPPLRRPTAKPASADVSPGAPPPPLDLELTPPPRMNFPQGAAAANAYAAATAAPDGDAAASFTLDLPGPDSQRPPATRPPKRHSVIEELRDRRSIVPDPRAEPDSDPAFPKAEDASQRETLRKAKSSTRPPPPPQPDKDPESHRPTPMRPPSKKPLRREEDDEHVTIPKPSAIPKKSVAPPKPAETPRASVPVTSFMHGAEHPLHKVESPPPMISRAPLLPKLGGPADELAEHLALPAGVATDARLDTLPHSVLEARVQFTLLARELGLDYRLKRGIDLRADASGLEAMQTVLLEMFPDRVVHNADEAY
ncbi:MAG TPA: hypothetical protein VIF62_35150, partial [Labilithrix sp.]